MQTYYTVVKPFELERLGFKRVSNFVYRIFINGRHLDCLCHHHFMLHGGCSNGAKRDFVNKLIAEGIVVKEYREDYIDWITDTEYEVNPNNGFNWNEDMYKFMIGLLKPLGSVGFDIATKLYVPNGFSYENGKFTIEDCERTLVYFSSMGHVYDLMGE